MKYYRITAQGPQVAEIRIDGPIGESWLEETTTAKSFIAELDALTSPTIRLYLNSPGGSLMDANAISSALERKKGQGARIECVVDGWALSAASLIAMAADQVEIGNKSLMMLHNPQGMAWGDAAAMRKQADILDKLKAGMVEDYNRRLKQDPAAVSAILDAESWYSAAEAVEAGLADAVITTNTAPAPVPPTMRAGFGHVPAAYAVYVQEAAPTEAAPEPESPAEDPPPAEPTKPVIPAQRGEREAPSEPEAPLPEIEPPETETPTALLHIGQPETEIRQQAMVAERERIREIRAAFEPWLNRGYDLAALRGQCEDDGSPLAVVHSRILHALGALAEPLASGQGRADDEVDVTALQKRIFNTVAGRKD